MPSTNSLPVKLNPTMTTLTHYCTQSNPMPPESKRDQMGDHWIHENAIEIDTDYGSLAEGGSYVKYRCPNCNHEFWVQLPD